MKDADAASTKLAGLRGRGWAVAVHNDYRLAGVAHTFWLMTKGDAAAKGEGTSDLEALIRLEAEIARIEAGDIVIPSAGGTRRLKACPAPPS